jgi:tetratricopeptide (TPR) repeat protein
LANVYLDEGRMADADACARRAVRQLESSSNTRPLALASAHNVLALIEYRRGMFAEAAPEFEKAARIFSQHLGPDHPEIVPYLVNLANTYLKIKRWSDAEDAANRALRLAKLGLGEDHPYHAGALIAFAKVCEKTGRTREGKAASRQAQTILAQRSDRERSLVSIDDLLLGR